ncbi:MAG: TIM44-like domain-containing protein [Pseudomonadota bacterium]
MTGKKFRNISAVAMTAAVFVMAAAPADARRGGSFGSRGSRTAFTPPTTVTAPNRVAPVQRTMADKQAPRQTAAQPGANARPGTPARSGGFAKGLLGGLLAGGLIAMLMGGGLGALGGSGMLMALLQVALLAGIVWFALRFFRRRSGLAPAGAPGMAGMSAFAPAPAAMPFTNPFAASPQPAPTGGSYAQPFAGDHNRDLAITSADKAAFEQLLGEVQAAFAAEDYGRLRACTTPEVMSYLAEELSQNATSGVKNDVSGTELLEAEVAEAWSEGESDFATISMQYHSIDVVVNRQTGAVVSGDPTRLTRTTELWTFVRDRHNPWRLSAIQEA